MGPPVILYKENNQYGSVLLDRRLARSLLIQLSFFRGKGMKYFRLFSYDADLTKRTKISIFEIDWEAFEEGIKTSVTKP